MHPDIDIMQVVSATMVLFALVDILGSIPLFLNFRRMGRVIPPFRAALYSLLILIGFLFVGRGILQLFGVDVSSFAVAGSLVIFIISVEMVFGVEIFKFNAPDQSITLVPVVFPLIAGPGTFTALLSLRATFGTHELIIAIFLNMIAVFVVLLNLARLQKVLGASGTYVMRQFFGVILMAIAVRLFTANMHKLFEVS